MTADGSPNIETHFFGLFDGHAGGKCSNYIAANLPNVLAEDASFFSNLPQALKRSFHQANEHFLKIAEKMKYHDGSTGICAVVRDSKVLVANVGDCRALIISGGRPIQMSIDQKPTNPEEQKRIVALGGTVVYCMGVARVNRVLAVSRAFGNRTLRSVIRPDAEMMQRELTKDDDYIVIASDGLWDVLKNKDVCDLCYSPFAQGSPQAIAEELVQSALMRGSMDNVTCVVVKLTEYVERLFSSRCNGGGGLGAGASVGAATSVGINGASAAASSGGPYGGSQQQHAGNNHHFCAIRDTALERSASLKNMVRAGSSDLGNSGGGGAGGQNQQYQQQQQRGPSNNDAGGGGGGGMPTLTRQYSLGSVGTGTRAEYGIASSSAAASVPPPTSATPTPALDNYLYAGRARSNSTASSASAVAAALSGAGGGSNELFQLPPTSNGGANNGMRMQQQQQQQLYQQHHQGASSTNRFVEEDEQTVIMPLVGGNGSGNNSNSNLSSSLGGGVGGGGSLSGGFPLPLSSGSPSIPYASRRPSTMGGGAAAAAAGNILGSRGSFTSAMPTLISMFGNTNTGGSLSNINNSSYPNSLPVSAGTSPTASSSGGGGGGGGGWADNSGNPDYSGSSFGSAQTDSTSGGWGPGNGVSNGGGGAAAAAAAGGGRVGSASAQQKPSALAAMFPINYRKPPPAKK